MRDRPPMPEYRVRRRAAGFTALGCTCMALVALGIGSALPAGSDATRPAAAGRAVSAVRQEALGPGTAPDGRRYAPVIWHKSRAVGRPNAGRLVNATKLPAEGRHFFTWDLERWRSPSPVARRYADDRLIRLILRVAADFAQAHPVAGRLTIGDLSHRRGGRIGSGLHASHQNGLDVDIYYPRRDRRERPPWTVAGVDHALAQDLVDRFVRAGAEYVFVGPKTGLTGPRGVVMALRRHDNHMHVRVRAR